MIAIPATYMGVPDASLSIEADEYGDSYTMTLTASDGVVIAAASGFRPGAARDFGDDAETAATFGSFLSAAIEDPEFASQWEVLTDAASDWTDALTLMGEEEISE